jgi:hypothetical protein
MILLCGIPSEPPIEMVHEELKKLDVPVVMFNQRHFSSMHMQFELSGSAVTGTLNIENNVYRLEDFKGIFTRLMDYRFLPELETEPEGSWARRYCQSLHDTLVQWIEVAQCRVVNRSAPMGSNMSKPFQAQLIREHGFWVPETLITNNPDMVRDFWKHHKKVIYKSISGFRSIVQSLSEEDIPRLNYIRWCPTQFQEFIPGIDVRVHTIGSKAFATAASSDATDYRYAYRQVGNGADMKEIHLDQSLSDKCVHLSSSLGLAFAGIDLKITPNDEVYCLEVNPCPVFSYYEANTGQPIGQAVAHFLAALK